MIQHAQKENGLQEISTKLWKQNNQENETSIFTELGKLEFLTETRYLKNATFPQMEIELNFYILIETHKKHLYRVYIPLLIL